MHFLSINQLKSGFDLYSTSCTVPRVCVLLLVSGLESPELGFNPDYSKSVNDGQIAIRY